MGTFTFMTVMALLSLMLLFLSVCPAIETSYYLTDDDFRDIYCPALDAGLGITESVGVCGHRCSRNVECLGFFYNPATRACNPRLEEVTNSSDCHTETGSRYYFNTALSCKTNPVNFVTGLYGVSNDQMTASSRWNQYYEPWMARVGRNKHWCAGANTNSQYLQVEFNDTRTVKSITTQGSCCSHDQWTRTYKLMYSTNCSVFETVKDEFGFDKIFRGNTNDHGRVTNELPTPIQARCVRLNPRAYVDHIALRLELLGCY